MEQRFEQDKKDLNLRQVGLLVKVDGVNHHYFVEEANQNGVYVRDLPGHVEFYEKVA